MIPFRCLCYLDDDESPTWFITTDKRTFERTSGQRERVPIDRLILVASGLNDPQVVGLFRKSQLARYQPHR